VREQPIIVISNPYGLLGEMPHAPIFFKEGQSQQDFIDVL